MIVFDPGAGEPAEWFVCFCRGAASPWVRCLPVGRFKHVRAFGLVPSIHTWIFFDPALDRTALHVARGDPARMLISVWMADAAVVYMPVLPRTKLRLRLGGGWCVPQIKHLIGLKSGALRPDALLQDCLRFGGKIVHGAINQLAAA